MNWKKLIATGELILARNYHGAENLSDTTVWWRDLALALKIKLQKNQEAVQEALHLLQIDRGEDYFTKAVDCSHAVQWLKEIVEEKVNGQD